MKPPKTNKSKSAVTKQVGLRLDAKLVADLKKFADANERDLSWVLTKVIRIGWPLFSSQQKTEAA